MSEENNIKGMALGDMESTVVEKPVCRTNPVEIVIRIVGPVGAGKTAVAEVIRKALEEAQFILQVLSVENKSNWAFIKLV